MTGGLASRPDGTSVKGGFRPDVEGLRAVAVGAVLLYHAGLPFAPGGYVGVDVFFVISGFLITGLLLSEIERTGTVSLVRFYSRRAKRLLPMTVVVLGTVVALSWLLLSPLRMGEVSLDVVTAGLYVINWRLAGQAVDYFAVGLQTSPVQHFWSLAIEEQFYIVWPTLLLIVAWGCRRAGQSLRLALAGVLATVAVASFVYGVYLTEQQAGAAYFSTLTRGWELALGGVLALLATSRLRTPRWVAAALAWAGLGAILWAVVRFGEDTLFPGTAALMPTLGTAAIIVAGFGSLSTAPMRLLTLAPVRHVGRISYSWYLWHWPVLVFAAAKWGDLSPLEGLAVVAISYIPTILTHHLIENPFLRSPTLNFYPRKALALGGVCTITSVILGAMLLVTTPDVQTKPRDQALGATALDEGYTLQKSAKAVRPSPKDASEDRARMDGDGCHVDTPDTEVLECVYGNASSKTTVVLFGDSHAMHYFPALDELAHERNWRLVALTKSSCPPARVHVYNGTLRREYAECDAWRAAVMERIAREDPDMIVTSSITTYSVIQDKERLRRSASVKALEAGYIATLQELRDTGAKVVVIRDVPRPPKDILECVSRSLDRLQDCSFPRSEALDYPAVNVSAANEVEGVQLIDATPVLCPDRTCPAVIGDVLVYENGSHITATYMRTLAPWFGERLPRLTASSRKTN